MWKKNDRIGKKRELLTVIPLMPIVGVNHRLRILHLSKRMVHIYSTEKTIHQFEIGYIINPSALWDLSV